MQAHTATFTFACLEGAPGLCRIPCVTPRLEPSLWHQLGPISHTSGVTDAHLRLVPGCHARAWWLMHHSVQVTPFKELPSLASMDGGKPRWPPSLALAMLDTSCHEGVLGGVMRNLLALLAHHFPAADVPLLALRAAHGTLSVERSQVVALRLPEGMHADTAPLLGWEASLPHPVRPHASSADLNGTVAPLTSSLPVDPACSWACSHSRLHTCGRQTMTWAERGACGGAGTRSRSDRRVNIAGQLPGRCPRPSR